MLFSQLSFLSAQERSVCCYMMMMMIDELSVNTCYDEPLKWLNFGVMFDLSFHRENYNSEIWHLFSTPVALRRLVLKRCNMSINLRHGLTAQIIGLNSDLKISSFALYFLQGEGVKSANFGI